MYNAYRCLVVEYSLLLNVRSIHKVIENIVKTVSYIFAYLKLWKHTILCVHLCSTILIITELFKLILQHSLLICDGMFSMINFSMVHANLCVCLIDYDTFP